MKTSTQLFANWYLDKINQGITPSPEDVLSKFNELKEKEKNDIVEAYLNGFTPMYSSCTNNINSNFRIVGEKYYEEKFVA